MTCFINSVKPQLLSVTWPCFLNHYRLDDSNITRFGCQQEVHYCIQNTGGTALITY